MSLIPDMLATILNDDGSHANFPQTAGKTPIFQPSVVPAGYYFWGTGAFDDLSPTFPASGRGSGEQIAVEVTGPDVTAVVEGQFHEHIYILGGHVGALDAEVFDWVSLDLLAPASTPEDRTGTNDGNATKVATPYGFNIIVPVPAENGDWNVDGAALTIGELNTGLVPVPNPSGQGYWNWDPTANPSITPVDNVALPDGAFDLFDAQLNLARQANRYPLLTPGNVTPASAIKGKKILPHWKWKFCVYRKNAGTAKLAIRLDTARLATT